MRKQDVINDLLALGVTQEQIDAEQFAALDQMRHAIQSQQTETTEPTEPTE